MGEQAPDPGPIRFDRYPEPACGYQLDGDEARVSGVNDAFEARFGPVATGTSVTATLEAAGLVPRGGAGSLVARLADGGAFVVDPSSDSDEATYVVQVVPPEGDGTGRLLFVDRGEPADGTPDRDSSPDLGVDHVASVVSHDLRNPLDVAKARLEAGRDLGDEEHFEHVAQAHDRMERIIQDVLTLARGEDVIDTDDAVELDALAESAWATVETEGGQLVVDGTLPTAVADPDRVSRLFENLFRNAVEHGRTPHGADTGTNEPVPGTAATDGNGSYGPVTVRVGPLEGADGFYVADDGPGVPPAERDRVFEPGYTATDRGTGFGLAIVARIVDVHGWSIDVTEAADGGARFEIRGVT